MLLTVDMNEKKRVGMKCMFETSARRQMKGVKMVKKALCIISLLSLLLFAAGCEGDMSAEEAGRSIDSALEQAQEKMDEMKGKAEEAMGEAQKILEDAEEKLGEE